MLLVLAVALLFSTGRKQLIRQMDYSLSFRKRDKIPYGTKVAYDNLAHLFPSASVVTERREPGNWDSLSTYSEEQALIIITPDFNPSETEMMNLMRFVQNGNDLFISAIRVSTAAEMLMNCKIFSPYYSYTIGEPDSMTVTVDLPAKGKTEKYSYPGHDLGYWFYDWDRNTSDVLGYHKNGKPDFIHMRTGSGNLYLHLTPMAFTNYFLLHKDNLTYYEKLMSVIPASRKILAWDEYYLYKRNGSEPKRNWLSVLMNLKNADGKKSFRVAIWVLLALLLVYTLMEMRRKQRYIPAMPAPRNDSLDFVKTIGRLYHDKGDHHNLARKMAAYFLEHVRNRYKLATNDLSDSFVSTLSFKSGVAEEEILRIVGYIRRLDQANVISVQDLASFHKQLESFYSKA